MRSQIKATEKPYAPVLTAHQISELRRNAYWHTGRAILLNTETNEMIVASADVKRPSQLPDCYEWLGWMEHGEEQDSFADCLASAIGLVGQWPTIFII